MGVVQPIGAQMLPVPKDGQYGRLGDSMVLNGKKVEIEHVSVPAALEATVKHYKEALGGRSSDVTRNGERFLGRLEQDYFTTVRIVPQGKDQSEVWVMRTEMGGSPGKLDTFGLGQPGGSTVTTSMESVDNGRRAKTLMYSNGLSVDANRDQLVSMMKERGFVLANDRSEQSKDGSKILWFQNGVRDAMATIADDGVKRNLVINLTEPK